MKQKITGSIEIVISVLLIYGGYSAMFSQYGYLYPNGGLVALGFAMVVFGAVLEAIGLITLDL